MIDVTDEITKEVTDYFEEEYPSDFLPTIITRLTTMRLWGRKLYKRTTKEHYLVRVEHWEGEKKRDKKPSIGFGKAEK
jgi:hypothetical protein